MLLRKLYWKYQEWPHFGQQQETWRSENPCVQQMQPWKRTSFLRNETDAVSPVRVVWMSLVLHMSMRLVVMFWTWRPVLIINNGDGVLECDLEGGQQQPKDCYLCLMFLETDELIVWKKFGHTLIRHALIGTNHQT